MFLLQDEAIRKYFEAAGLWGIPPLIEWLYWNVFEVPQWGGVKKKYATDAPPDGFSTDGLENKANRFLFYSFFL
jgi:hypothetical protein